MIVVIDYGMGNIGTIAAKIKKLDQSIIVSSDVDDIERADKLVLPGVGSFKAAMQNFYNLGITSALERQVIRNKIPILGICLGMQLFTRKSEEGDCNGFGWIDAETVRFNEADQSLRIPHMGWNIINIKNNCSLLSGIENGSRFYFSHSYHVRCCNPDDIIATTEYGDEFCSVVNHKNIYGVQFHPERSHKRGFMLLSSFIRGD
jgi:glutamine amidotransferase